MIKLKNVSKYYYSKGIIASGFSNVSLELNFGEFVVITGESGSGKSTLLNVISGLDTYEEGELYIDGVETSHYTAANFEEYRKKYIGNIFQEFNLINSYTVYQNIELVRLINGKKKKDVKKEVLSIIEKVGLGEYANTKCSKLSGGQKQRVAIARALAKETPIIVADEPTGNLDSVSAEGIVALLKEISKDKLVIVVTHNYEQFEQHATRMIKMGDGKIVEDRKLKVSENQSLAPAASSKKISGASQFRLGVRNTFNVMPKFLLLLVVFLFVVVSVTGAYTSFKYQKEEANKYGSNGFFMNYTEDRVVIKKADGKPINEEDFGKLASLENVKSVQKNDMVVDTNLSIEGDDFYFDAFPADATSFKGQVDLGKIPEKKNEILLEYNKEHVYMEGDAESYLNKTFTLSSWDDEGEKSDSKLKGKIVGIHYTTESDTASSYGKMYLSEQLMEQVKESTYKKYSQSNVTINGKTYSSYSGMYSVVPSAKVPKGEVYVPTDVHYLYKSQNALKNKINIKIENIYFKDNMKPTITKAYTKKNFETLTGYKDFDLRNGEIYVNKKEYSQLFERGFYQSSIYVKDVKNMAATLKQLETMGYEPFAIKDHLTKYGDAEILSIIQIPFLVVFIIAIFFIAYFVSRLILKSRGAYFATLRMLGLAKTNIKRILDIELCAVISIAYALFIGLVAMLKMNVIRISYMQSVIDYFQVTDYVLLYGVLLFMVLLISRRFSKSIFKKSAMVTFREEA